ncbi:peptide deformylase [Sediminispirochaeta smaragdinae]|jgi:peptide deformylase|uniref:Peptide deformylase n=1 Tax=Sediminispirochaeta smaragdinae (strain DSM 11293 / JCM 15392 / SEBR 4228) TaxID=573413 RepID=E1R616_SEDSS|nr:peptide deformylase [Sediminispirochaeta smaragdinae]ADK80781.1 peptide deformylase [Sediminispirochaeta smaragdinae DSM 11293]
MKILTLGNELLRERTATVAEVDESIRRLADDMIVTMHEDDGVGLAAPQIGVLKRLFVCHVRGDVPRVFINPEIIGTSQEQVRYEEGCLSIPGIYADVLRPESIQVQAIDENGKAFKLAAEGLLARVIQHEMDHLKGVLFIDHLEERKRRRLLKLYEKRWRG